MMVVHSVAYSAWRLDSQLVGSMVVWKEVQRERSTAVRTAECSVQHWELQTVGWMAARMARPKVQWTVERKAEHLDEKKVDKWVASTEH